MTVSASARPQKIAQVSAILGFADGQMSRRRYGAAISQARLL